MRPLYSERSLTTYSAKSPLECSKVMGISKALVILETACLIGSPFSHERTSHVIRPDVQGYYFLHFLKQQEKKKLDGKGV